MLFCRWLGVEGLFFLLKIILVIIHLHWHPCLEPCYFKAVPGEIPVLTPKGLTGSSELETVFFSLGSLVDLI